MEEKVIDIEGSTVADDLYHGGHVVAEKKKKKVTNDNKDKKKITHGIFAKLPSRKERRAEAKKNKVDFAPQYNGGVIWKTKTKAETKIIMNKIVRDKKNEARGVAAE